MQVYLRSPLWFYGIDSLAEFIVIIASFMISYYSYSIFHVLRSRRHKYFSVAFFLIGVSYLFKIFSNILVYRRVNAFSTDLLATLTSEIPHIDLLHIFSFFMFKMLSVIGFMIVFFIATEISRKATVLVTLYLSFLGVLLSSFQGMTIYHSILAAYMFFIWWYWWNTSRKLGICRKIYEIWWC